MNVLELFLKIESRAEKKENYSKDNLEHRNEKLQLLFELNYDGMTLFAKSVWNADYMTDEIRNSLSTAQKMAEKSQHAARLIS